MSATRVITTAVLGILLVGAMAAPAGAAVTINEFKAKATEFIELYNSGAAVDVTGWQLCDNAGTVLCETLTGVIAAGGFMNVVTTLGLSNDGAVIELKDASGAQVDRVGYGNLGGAPLGFNSTGRSPDGDDTNDDARDFEYLDDSVNPAGETPGAPNVHGSPGLGGNVLLNELDPFGTGQADLFDRVELYNPFAAPANIQGYVISDGDGWCRITGPLSIAPGGFLVLTEGVAGEGMDCTGFDLIEFGASDVCYLYDANNRRIDQLGITGAPTVNPGQTLQRCPDGAAPYDGYNYLTSGGGSSYIVGSQTEGITNTGSCPVAVEATTWGQLKATYRQ